MKEKDNKSNEKSLWEGKILPQKKIKKGENEMPTVVFEPKGNGLPKHWNGRIIKTGK